MKKILFSLIALVCCMSMNAQVMKVMQNGEVVAKFNGADYKFVFEKATIGTAKRTGDIEVNWVQLWKDGPKFAEYNVGAANNQAEDYGGYYCWGGIIDKDSKGAYKEGTDDLTDDDDTATKLWGRNWRMPTLAELQALYSNCDVTWTDNYNNTGIKGCTFTGKGDYEDNSVFLPAAGHYDYSEFTMEDHGYYWSSTGDGIGNAYRLSFRSENQTCNNAVCRYGQSVRAVLAE